MTLEPVTSPHSHHAPRLTLDFTGCRVVPQGSLFNLHEFAACLVLLFVFLREALGDRLGVPEAVRRGQHDKWGPWEEISGLECQEESRAGFVGVQVLSECNGEWGLGDRMHAEPRSGPEEQGVTLDQEKEGDEAGR